MKRESLRILFAVVATSAVLAGCGAKTGQEAEKPAATQGETTDKKTAETKKDDSKSAFPEYYTVIPHGVDQGIVKGITEDYVKNIKITDKELIVTIPVNMSTFDAKENAVEAIGNVAVYKLKADGDKWKVESARYGIAKVDMNLIDDVDYDATAVRWAKGGEDFKEDVKEMCKDHSEIVDGLIDFDMSREVVEPMLLVAIEDYTADADVDITEVDTDNYKISIDE